MEEERGIQECVSIILKAFHHYLQGKNQRAPNEGLSHSHCAVVHVCDCSDWCQYGAGATGREDHAHCVIQHTKKDYQGCFFFVNILAMGFE